MGYHIKYEELTRVRESMLRDLDGWLEQLETVKSSLRIAADMPEMKGAAGDSVRSYLKEVHLSLVEMISDTIRVYRDNLVRYTGWYYSIETDMMAEFSQEAIENQMELLNSGRFAYDETMEELNGILSEVGNYMSIEPVSRLPVTSKYATTYIHLDNLNNMIGQYEESHKNGDLTLTREMIENITAVIRRQQGLSGDTISTYQPGSISDLPAFQKASLQNGLQKNYITLTRELVEDSEAIYTERQEAWEEAVRQRKEQEFVNMMAALGTLILGGVVIICTFGAATPLVAGTTAVTVSSVVSLSAGLTIGSGAFLYGESNLCEAYDSYQYGLAGDARTVAVNPIRDTIFASDPGLYYTVGNACTMTAAMMLPVGGSMTAAVHAGTSPVRAGLTELGMLGYSSVMATEAEDIVTDLTDSELAGMVAGTIVGIGSYGGLKSLDQSVNISGLYPLKETPNSYAELMAPEEAERYLKFLEKGSTEGLTDAELEAIRKVDEALALKKVDGQSVPGLRGPAAIEGGKGVKYSPVNPGPLKEEIANSFNGAKYIERVLTEDTVMYRVNGGNAGKVGSYMSMTPQGGGLQSQLDLALNPAWGNTTENVTKVMVPKGTTIYEGIAAPQNIYDSLGNVIGTLPGGGNQVYIPKVEAGWFQ